MRNTQMNIKEVPLLKATVPATVQAALLLDGTFSAGSEGTGLQRGDYRSPGERESSADNMMSHSAE